MLPLLTANQLLAGDILLKWIPDKAPLSSQVIELYQKIATTLATGHLPQYYRSHYGIDPSQFTHVAMVYSDGDILEYDESSGFLEIMKCHGAGCIKLPPRHEKYKKHHYLVFRCTEKDLTELAVAHMEFIYRHWKEKRTSSYGIRKLLSNLWGYHGPHLTGKKLHQVISKLEGEQHSWFRTNRQNFFCSQFVCFVYLWAAYDLVAEGKVLDKISDLLDTDQYRLPPSELALKLITSRYFQVMGEFIPAIETEAAEKKAS